MRMRLVWLTASIMIVLLGAMSLKQAWQKPEAEAVFSNAVIKYGSRGEDVYELQGRMKYLGFYHGKIDGIFGPQTLKSLRWFQSEFGLKVDGIAGGKTKVKLWEATKQWSPDRTPREDGAAGGGGASGAPARAPSNSANRLGLSEQDIKLMANAVYGEARGEPYEGQVAVAAVILNRVRSPEFPDTVSGVIFEPGAFTAVADGQIWLTPNETARRAVMDAINGVDPTDGCLYYFNPKTATSAWIWTRPQYKQIGQHIFCR
ncbi:spore cortex-lytic enzyme [Paenibacillus thermoaerophilus]|uniref:Spore cortex-lytic enzyme n=1 Tax=Paenibacillus thermoaerophilus TaxID=1215385 RepID=A0ABW2V307_9BACL|nr:spore cortex-lytic enzyme [Paenibacillus thermoaerophilus]TMV13854.1 spore cortex-lytic enzyme [Paenibacillus thermoaerophilus]